MTGRKIPWSRRLALPLAVLTIGLGLAFLASDAEAEENADSQPLVEMAAPHSNLPDTTLAPDPARAPTGSGAQNVYSQESIQGLPPGPDPGKQLYIQSCATCHGSEGEGTEIAPSLRNAGAAAVDFYVGTGRMPLHIPMAQAPRREPVFTEEQIDAMAQYVATFGEGPAIPEVDPAAGDLVEGNQLYSNNCAACHNSSGSGGSVGRDYYAPNIYAATPLEVAEAIRIGPGAMPVFSAGTFSDEQVNSIVRYVEYLQANESPGGLSIGRLGPFSEGFIAWIVGLGSLLGIARWIGTRE